MSPCILTTDFAVLCLHVLIMIACLSNRWLKALSDNCAHADGLLAWRHWEQVLVRVWDWSALDATIHLVCTTDRGTLFSFGSRRSCEVCNVLTELSLGKWLDGGHTLCNKWARNCGRVREQLLIKLTDYLNQILNVFEHFWHLIEWIKLLHGFESFHKAINSSFGVTLHHRS